MTIDIVDNSVETATSRNAQPQQRAHGGHQESGLDAMTADIADHQAEVAILPT
jgi:hypothetical protein